MINGGGVYRKVKIRKTVRTLGLVASAPLPTQVTAAIMYPGPVTS